LYDETATVIIPVLNEREGLSNLLKGLLKQLYRPLEVVIVDGGSTDGSLEVASGVVDAGLARGIRMTILKESDFGSRRSPANARNLGILHSSGNFVLFFDGDFVVSDENLVGKVVEGLKECESIGLYTEPADNLWLEYHAWVDRFSKERNGVVHTFCGYARRVFQRGLFDITLGFGEDMEFHRRVGVSHTYIDVHASRHFVHTFSEWRSQMRWYGRTYPLFARREGLGAVVRLAIWVLPFWVLVMGLVLGVLNQGLASSSLILVFLLLWASSLATSARKNRFRLVYVFLAKTYALFWLNVGLIQCLYGRRNASRF